jgi:hypothetical protein
MRINPTKTMTDQLRPKVEAEVRNELQIQLRNEMEKKLNSYESGLSDEQKGELLERMFGTPKIDEVSLEKPIPVVDPALDTTKLSNSGGTLLAGADAISRLSESLGSGIPSGSGRLMGIVGTDKLPNAESNQSDQ